MSLFQFPWLSLSHIKIIPFKCITMFPLTWLCFHCFSLDILSFFERFFPQHSFFTEGSKFLLFKCIIMCPLKYFSCPLGYICFGSNINSFQHASNTYGRKTYKGICFYHFSQILLFPTRTFYMVLQHTHMFPKTENCTYKGAFWTNTHRDSEVDF